MSKIYYQNEYSTDILFEVQDSCGPVYRWPKYIKDILVSNTFQYSERIKLTTFFWVNGYRNCAGWLQFLIRIKGPGFIRYDETITRLFLYFQQDEVQRKYFSFCVTHQVYEYLDGTIKHKNDC